MVDKIECKRTQMRYLYRLWWVKWRHEHANRCVVLHCMHSMHFLPTRYTLNILYFFSFIRTRCVSDMSCVVLAWQRSCALRLWPFNILLLHHPKCKRKRKTATTRMTTKEVQWYDGQCDVWVPCCIDALKRLDNSSLCSPLPYALHLLLLLARCNSSLTLSHFRQTNNLNCINNLYL